MPATVTVLDSTGTTQTVNTLPALGQGLKAASLPVTVASDQGALAVNSTVVTLPALVGGSAVIGKVGIDQTTPGTTNAVSITNASMAVTGAFWQATQPVSGTFWQATQPVSLAALPALVAGAALIGKVGIDQTTVGTTNAVSLAQIGANTILTGNGVTGTGSQRVTIASDQTAFSVNAVQSGTWNVTNLSQFGGAAINLGAGVVASGTLRTTQASDSPLVAVTGATTDAAVGNGTAGTLAGYLRSIKDAATDTTTPSPVKVDQTTPGTTNAVALAQIGANTILTGNGVTGTGSQRVTIASDQTAFSVNATQVVGSNSTTGDTGAKTATGNGATQTNAGNKGVQILFAIGTVSGTSPTFVGKVQGSVDGGTTWFDIPGATTASLTATGSFGIMIYPGVAVTAGTMTTGTTATASMALPRSWRVVWTIGGTTPSFTITNVQFNYLTN